MHAREGEAVVCVHGLWLSGFAMRYWRRRCAAAGFAAHAFSYPSVRGSLAQNGEALARFALGVAEPVVHFAGHSLGAITIMSMLASRGWRLEGKTLGRIVLAGPPYQGSQAGRALVGGRNRPAVLGSVGGALAGRTLKQWLAVAPPAVPAGIEVGVIAGDASLGLGRLVAPDLERPHDGTISVKETRIAGAREHLVLPVGHTAMLMSPQVTRRMLHFLETGSFG
jgi:pimeloyl-ACP methyl ester carboxylesterase